ncbi:chemotaxis protein CheB [Mycobacterium sp. SMC-2]|uniref:chemotaxis protein CheB n=1 Tax=Mycobacterium sp. SMC-2 TaxID=2857058 RepID=UPI0021B28628|nr:chemotaxis protein CheB [Mycobacterium sp. SMC-2]UXA08398.1 chemotaxis protein CheB [Mycobacterium sp. SMC-2]
MASSGHGPAVELVVLLASAGGLDALSTVLGDLPTGFPAAIVVQQHLGDHDSVLPAILRRQTGRRVGWVRDGQPLARGEVVVCPPGMHLELTPEGRCRLRPLHDIGAYRFDVLLRSVAESYGPRSVAAVLSGSGRDGAAGTAAMKRAGAVVIAQRPDTALYASMPVAAARAGADLVLPIREIGRALAGIVEGAPPPEPQPREDSAGCPAPLAQNPGRGAGDAPAPAPALPLLLREEATNGAAYRSELAGLRAAELSRRRTELSAGSGATTETVATARRRAAESRRRAQLAHQAAKEAAARSGR